MSAAITEAKKSVVEAIADAVLYEGYLLYPYRATALKNQQRWNFGVVCPPFYETSQGGGESSLMQTECVCEVDESSVLSIRIRFLQLSSRDVVEPVDCELLPFDCGHVINEVGEHFAGLPLLEMDGVPLQPWQEAIERDIHLPDIKFEEEQTVKSFPFSFPATKTFKPVIDPETGSTGALMVQNRKQVVGEVRVTISQLRSTSVSPDEQFNGRQAIKLTIAIRNLTENNDTNDSSRVEALLLSFVSTHTIVEITNGAFVSSLEVPPKYESAVASCKNIGTFPVLVGEGRSRNCILSSPIILYDYPQIAPESAGDLFDGTEIDEILTLRIMSLTDNEKLEMRSVDEMARKLLERTENMTGKDLMTMHGVMKRETVNSEQ